MKIAFKNCPWQERGAFWANPEGTTGKKWGWNPFKDGGMGRFGGGWMIKFGVLIGGSTTIIDFGVGSLRIDWKKK
jgi:hypothetical protein